MTGSLRTDPSDSASGDGAPTVVLGIDPGTAITGYGIVSVGERRHLALIECGVIRTSSSRALPSRIREIFEGVRELIEAHHPSVMSVEDVFQGKNVRSALTLGHARGAILLAGSLSDLTIAEYSPRAIKSAVVGSGGASKDQVGWMVQKHLRLKTVPTPADAADGVAAAICHALVGSLPI